MSTMLPHRFLFLLCCLLAVSYSATWTKRNPTPSAASFTDVVWGSVPSQPNTGIWVIGGYRGGLSLLYSTDGKTWMSGNHPQGFSEIVDYQSVLSLTFDQTLGFFASADNDSPGSPGVLLQSSDGINWNLINVTNPDCNNLQELFSANGILLASIKFDSSGYCLSKDGKNWNRQSDPYVLMNPVTLDGSELFTATNWAYLYGTVYVLTSENGVDWSNLTSISIGNDNYGSLIDFVQAEGYYIASTSYGDEEIVYFYTSTDLNEWNLVNLTSFSGEILGADINTGNGITFLGIEANVNTSIDSVYRTDDGITFTLVNISSSIIYQKYENGLWFGLGLGYLSVADKNAESFVAYDLGITNGIQFYTVNPLNDQFALQVNGLLYHPSKNAQANDTSTFLTSSDSINWKFASYASVTNIRYSSELGAWFGVSDNDGSVSATYTTDFMSWATLDFIETAPFFSNAFVQYVDGAFIMVLEYKRNGVTEYGRAIADIYKAVEGQSWSLIQSITYKHGFDFGYAAGFGPLAYGNGVFVLPSYDNGTYTSSDAVSWSLDTAQTFQDVMIFDFIGDSNVGGFFECSWYSGPCVYSKDGVNWTPTDISSQVVAINFVDGRFVATDADGYYWTSDLGMSWKMQGRITIGAFNFFDCNSQGYCGAASTFDNSIYTATNI
eukprot:TRINITY_DN3075_c0_g1_i1.p1 TRINITY_DN3075_c0_g1~~TRINITY_DN3075_c0_g1_i1.p1  ORF type:complete len:666 (-),score=89.65 TRINITY_DN3075_c0_g1_i1:148-2145(-)